MSCTKDRWVKMSVVVALTGVLTVGCIVAIGLAGIQGAGNTGPMIKGTVKWFNDAYLNAVNALLSGTGLTIDRYEGPRLDGIGIRIEPPLGLRVTDNNNPPKSATGIGGKVPPPSATKKIVGVFETTVAIAAAPGEEPWVTMTASNAGAAEGTPDDKTDGLSGRSGFIWGVSIRSLPPGGLYVQFAGQTYQVEEDTVAGGGLTLSPGGGFSGIVPIGCGVHGHRESDHVGIYSLIPVANQLLGGGPNQQATKKITGIRIDAEVARLDAGEDCILLSVAVEPPQADKATPWKHHDIQVTKIDLVAERDGDAWGTLDCLWPDATIAGWPSKEPAYMLEVHGLPAAVVPITYGGQVYLLGTTNDGGGLALTPTAD